VQVVGWLALYDTTERTATLDTSAFFFWFFLFLFFLLPRTDEHEP